MSEETKFMEHNEAAADQSPQEELHEAIRNPDVFAEPVGEVPHGEAPRIEEPAAAEEPQNTGNETVDVTAQFSNPDVFAQPVTEPEETVPVTDADHVSMEAESQNDSEEADTAAESSESEENAESSVIYLDDKPQEELHEAIRNPDVFAEPIGEVPHAETPQIELPQPAEPPQNAEGKAEEVSDPLLNPDVFAHPINEAAENSPEIKEETVSSETEPHDETASIEPEKDVAEPDGSEASEPLSEVPEGKPQEVPDPAFSEESINDEARESNEAESQAQEEEMVEQLSLLDGELPHLEAANAPNAKTAKAVLEGLLFIVGDEGINLEQAATALDITPELAAEYFDELMKDYLEDDRGIEIASYGGVYRFLSKAFVHEYAKRLFQISKHAVLSQAALETLAIIAYKQPITRVEIEEIRGVGADMMLRKLLARDLIKESGRSEAAGRPILYEVTDEFMNSFKLLSLKELPELPQFNSEEESEDLFTQ